ncbi:glycosyltransferase family 2 protein [Verrucomicrobiota bacterium]
MKLLSIIIPIHNAENSIGRTLQSLDRMAVRSKNSCELIIVDDGSTDNSTQVVDEKQSELDDFDIKLFAQENKGSGSARNAALNKCEGTWILFLDADDELFSDPVPVLEQYPDSSCIGFSVNLYKDPRHRTVVLPTRVTQRNYLRVFTSRNPFAISSLIFKKDRITTMFDENFMYLEDWLFWVMNPDIFKEMEMCSARMIANIHWHPDNKTSNELLHGKYRQKAAETMMDYFGDKLDPKQKNNLRIQADIGRIQQGGRTLGALLPKIPCNMTLYAKLIMYYLKLARPFQPFK